MKRVFNIFIAGLFLSPALVFAADNFLQPASKQNALPDNLIEWMSARYGAKTMLGLNWETPEKAKVAYALEKNKPLGFGLGAPRFGLNALGNKPGLRGGAEASEAPKGRLDIMPLATFIDPDALDMVTNSYTEIKYTNPGGVWNVGYIKYSVTRNDWIFDYTYASLVVDSVDGDKYRTTEANVVFSSLVLTLPGKQFSGYVYGGPAIASYDYAETGGATVEHNDYNTSTFTSSYVAFDAKKSGTAITWIVGAGGALSFGDSGFGLFAEYKHMPEAGYFPGMDNLGAGVSFGF